MSKFKEPKRVVDYFMVSVASMDPPPGHQEQVEKQIRKELLLRFGNRINVERMVNWNATEESEGLAAAESGECAPREEERRGTGPQSASVLDDWGLEADDGD